LTPGPPRDKYFSMVRATRLLEQKMFRRASVKDDLRLEYPDGRTRRAYYANFDRTRVRGTMRVGGKIVTVYGRAEDGKLVPIDSDPDRR
jgi:hypothetical protein